MGAGLVISWFEILLAALAAFGVGLLAGWWPARHRAQESALDAVQHRERNEQLAGQLEEARATVAEQAGQLKDLHNERDALDRMRVRLEADVETSGARVAELRRRAAELERMVEEWRGRAETLDRNLIELRAAHQEKLAAFEELKRSFEQAKVAMRTEFQHLAQQVLEEKGKAFSESNRSSLDGVLRPFRDQIAGFQKRVNEVHDASLRGQTQLEAEIRRVLDIGLKMSAEANTLATALKGEKKTTGNWGEVQLERSLQLAGLVPGDHYESQAPFKDEAGNRRYPDFVIKLPDGKHMVIDSKVSLVDYDRAIAAETEEAREAALAAHVQAVRRHIDDLAGKDYSNLSGMKSPGFVLMFMPIEPAYIEAMKHNRELFDYGYRSNIVMVSHTTLMPILRTVANLWMMARSNEQTRALSDMAGTLYNQVAVVAERLQKLGHTLSAANAHYNRTVTAVAGQQGLYGKVNRFAELSTKVTRSLPDMEPMHADIEVQRLAGVAPDAAEQDAHETAPDGAGVWLSKPEKPSDRGNNATDSGESR